MPTAPYPKRPSLTRRSIALCILIALLATSCGQAGIETSTPNAAGQAETTATDPAPSAAADASATMTEVSPTATETPTTAATATPEPTATTGSEPSPTAGAKSADLELIWFIPTQNDVVNDYIPLEGETAILTVEPQWDAADLSLTWRAADPTRDITPLLMRVQCGQMHSPDAARATLDELAGLLITGAQDDYALIELGAHGHSSQTVTGQFTVTSPEGTAGYHGSMVLVQYHDVLCTYEVYDDVDASVKLLDGMITRIMARVDEHAPATVVDPTPTANATLTPESTPVPEPTSTPAASPTPEAYAYLYDLLPTLADLPEGFELTEEATFSLDDGLSDITEEEAEQLSTWGFTGAAYRAFAAEDRDPDADFAIMVASVVYEFGASSAAQDATRWIMDDLLAQSEGDDFKPADIPQIGELSLAAQALMTNPDSPEAGEYGQAIVAVAEGARVYFYWWAEFSPGANALDDCVTLAQTVAAR